jgi:hypothetical protein
MVSTTNTVDLKPGIQVIQTTIQVSKFLQSILRLNRGPMRLSMALVLLQAAQHRVVTSYKRVSITIRETSCA